MENVNLQLISDKAALYFLEQSDHESEAAKETKHLIMRVIAGDNPTQNEWRDNANIYANSSDVNSYGHAYASANISPNISPYLSPYISPYISPNISLYISPYNTSIVNTNAANKTVDYMIKLLDGYIKPMAELDSKVLAAINAEGCSLDVRFWHDCDTTHCRGGWEITLHPQGAELEKYFGPCMAATIIHKISTGKTVDYFASKEDVMKDLQNSSQL